MRPVLLVARGLATLAALRFLTWGVLALGLAVSGAAQNAPLGRWKVRAALVLNDLEIRAVPLHNFRLVGQPDTTLAVPGRTGLDGTAEGMAPAGQYLLVSDAPVRATGLAYSWRVPIEVSAGRLTEVELTNANAAVDSTIAEDIARSGRRLEDAVTAYRRIRRGVFRVEAGAGQGSGFLVDSVAGLVVTNAHVVTNQSEASVVLDSVTRVAAVILARSEVRDIAVLWVAPEAVSDRPGLALADPKATSALVEPGERIFAIGYPLSQEQTLTTGIVSSIRAGAIMSDVNINPGNSGGPMLNYSAVVVGVNAFVDASPSTAGVSGAIVATEIWPVLEQARLAMDGKAPPSGARLPTMPLTTYAIDSLRSHADTASPDRLKEYAGLGVGPFQVSLSSPVALYLKQRAYDAEIARDRRKREAAAGIDPSQRYSSIKEFRDWYRFASDALTPVVMVIVEPEIGETTGSFLGRAFASGFGVQARAKYTYKGDVSAVRIYRNGVRWEVIRGGTTPVEQYVDNQWVSLKDVANIGLFVVSPLLFAPDTAGVPPSIVIEIADLKARNELRCLELRSKTVAYTWNDFLPYVRANHPEVPARMANHRRKPEEFAVGILPGDSVVTTKPRRDWKTVWPNCQDLGLR